MSADVRTKRSISPSMSSANMLRSHARDLGPIPSCPHDMAQVALVVDVVQLEEPPPQGGGIDAPIDAHGEHTAAPLAPDLRTDLRPLVHVPRDPRTERSTVETRLRLARGEEGVG